jgi:hypothetical protein
LKLVAQSATFALTGERAACKLGRGGSLPPAMFTAFDAASPVADPHRSGRSPALPLVFGLAVGGLTTAAFLTASAVRAVGSRAIPIASIMALLLLLGATPLLRRVARWAGSPLPERAAAWSLLGSAPLLFLGAKMAIGNDPLVTSHWRCGTGDVGLMILSPLGFMLLGTLGGLFAFVTAAFSARSASATPRGFAARGALIVAAILVAAATLRALHHPSSDGASQYLDALPTVAVLAPIDRATARVTLSPRESAPALEQLTDETRFGDITARRTCSEGSCTVALQRAGSPLPAERMWGGGGQIPADTAVAVRRDTKHGFWIVGGQAAFRDSDLQVTDISVHDVGDDLSAPTGWILGGLSGIVIAVTLWIRRRPLAQRLLRLDDEGTREGVLGDNGWITFHDDSPARRASPDLALAPGPVVLMALGSSGASATGAYRTEGAQGSDEIVSGTRADLASSLRKRLRDLDALAFVTVAITVSPLVAAWSSRLLF